ncbi:MAG: hypothetical protein M3068_06710 [Gemmatimonadota bacterium]|nr:hypothetical protein [Gemmatimonadota bacterium]
MAAPIVAALIGVADRVPDVLVSRHPELASLRVRRGGLPARIGGWALGQRSVVAITLWRTVFLGVDVEPNAELLLHEARHVQQFLDDPAFPIRYLWESVRHGYYDNRFELDARDYARERLRASSDAL